jgi:AAA+ superfamily predicted ATPase
MDEQENDLAELLSEWPDVLLDKWLTLAELYTERYGCYKNLSVLERLGVKNQHAISGAKVNRSLGRKASIATYSAEITKLEEELFNYIKDKSPEKETDFGNLINRYGLVEDQVKVLVILTWLEMQYAFERMHHSVNTLSLLQIIFLRTQWALERAMLLYEDSNLIKNNLIEQVSVNEGPRSVQKQIFYRPSQLVLTTLLGPLGLAVYDSRERDFSPIRVRRGSRRENLNIFSPRVRLSEVALPEDTRRAVQEALAIVEQRELLFNEWKLGKVLEKGKGTILLFYGSPGTGKSMTAEALAEHLGKQVCAINIAQLEDCYLGETEKNIEAVFARAQEEGLFLLFDECDSFISTREEKDSLHRYYGKVVNLLLREIEEFDGVLVMTTNRYEALDTALERRIALRVHFNRPGKAERRAIWQRFLSLEGAIGDDVDIAILADEYELSGGDIRNGFYAGARAAATRVSEGRGERVITMEDLLRGIHLVQKGAGESGQERIGF